MAKKPLSMKLYKFLRNIFCILILKSVWRDIYRYICAKKVCKYLKEVSIKTGKPVVIYVSHYNYYYPLIQRPNHIFNILSAKGYPCVVCGNKHFVVNPQENLFIIPTYYLNIILRGNFEKVFDISLGFPYRDIKDINKYIINDALVLYELIDDFDLLSDKKIINKAKQMFIDLVKRENTYVLVSARNLKDTAISLGASRDKIIDSKNGVILQDFEKDTVNNEIVEKIKKKNKPIIGYYGALTATWFDFDLISELVKKHPEYEFVLMGLIYPDKNEEKTNGYINNLQKYENFTYIPPVHYSEIPSYAKCWDVATIPFQINDITLSTSPVKLFEYMAMGLPIVTTPMPECKLYKSVFVAKDIKEFEEKIKTAISKKEDEKYKKLLHKEALENTWEQRVNDFVKIIEDNHKG